MKTLQLLAFVLSTLLLASCASVHNSTQTLTNFDSGKQVNLAVGQVFVAELPSDSTTGYRWNYLQDEQAIIEVVGKPQYLFGSAVDGSGGKEVWTFRAIKVGQQELRLDYSRPWGQKEAVMEKVSFKVVVSGAGH